jgi:environmental stress-induced protein Ves
MRLDGDGHAALLAAPFEPYSFSGDDTIDCTLVDGPVRDFNLMLRRGRRAAAWSSRAMPARRSRPRAFA